MEMVRMVETLAFGAADTNKTTGGIEANGMIRAMVLVLPNFTTAATCTKIDIYDTDSHLIYTNSTGWAENAVHLISSLAVPIDVGYTVKVTLNDVAGGAHTVKVKLYVE